jgi:hypothetical protein
MLCHANKVKMVVEIKMEKKIDFFTKIYKKIIWNLALFKKKKKSKLQIDGFMQNARNFVILSGTQLGKSRNA